jgi:hypothetical protein
MTIPANYGTPERLITTALRDCGKLADDTEADSAQLLDGMQRLADLLYFHQTQGLKLWLLEDVEIPIVASQAMYTLGPGGNVDMLKPFRVEFGYRTEGTDENRSPLTPLSYEDYTRLSNTTQTGQVSQYFVDKRLSFLNIWLWLVPDANEVANGSVHLVVRTKATHLVDFTAAMTFPPEWYLALRWALADELASGMPQTIQARCNSFSEKYIDALQNFDIEDVPVMFQADLSQISGRGFR